MYMIKHAFQAFHYFLHTTYLVQKTAKLATITKHEGRFSSLSIHGDDVPKK